MRGKKKKPFDPFDEDTYPGEDMLEQELTPPVWPEVLEVILAERLPGTADDYNERLTSQEIQTLIYNHCGQSPRKDELLEFMKEKRYTYTLTGSMLEWLLKKK